MSVYGYCRNTHPYSVLPTRSVHTRWLTDSESLSAGTNGDADDRNRHAEVGSLLCLDITVVILEDENQGSGVRTVWTIILNDEGTGIQ